MRLRRMRLKYGIIDTHVHLWEYDEQAINTYCADGNLLLMAVSDNLESSKRTLEIAEGRKNVLAGVGIHPWEVSKASEDDLKATLSLVRGAHFIGEVGLDKLFVPKTFSKQVKFFEEFVESAVRHGKILSIHAAGAWSDVLEVLRSAGVKLAVIHWFTGPLHLLKVIEDLGYFIGVNPAIKVQEKSRKVVKAAPLSMLLTESDGPYKYRGMELGPELIPETIRIIAELKSVNPDVVYEAIRSNAENLLTRAGIMPS